MADRDRNPIRLTRITRRLGARAWRWFLVEESGSRAQELIVWTALLVLCALAVSSGFVAWFAAVALALAGWIVALVAGTPAAIAIVAVIAALRVELRRRRAPETASADREGPSVPADLSERPPIDRGAEPEHDPSAPALSQPDEGPHEPGRAAIAAAPDGDLTAPQTVAVGTEVEPPTKHAASAFERALAEARAEARELDAAA